MKKAYSVLMAALLCVAVLAGCSSGASSSEAASQAPAASESMTASMPASASASMSETTGGEMYKVFLITMDQMDQHWVNVNTGAQNAAEELGNVEYKWLAPDVKDDAKQIEQINNAVADGAQAILLAANGPDAVTSALQEASDAGVVIVYVDSPADFPAAATFATDNMAAGRTAGAEMIKKLEAGGVTSGSIGIVNVNASTQSVVDREAGFREAFEGTEFTILETQYGDGDAARSKDIAANYITQGVVGIFGTNEGSTVGAGNAIAEDGNVVVGVGFDKSDMIKTLLASGALYCVMAQNPAIMGHDGMVEAVGVLDGGIQPDGMVVDTGVTVVTVENADAA